MTMRESTSLTKKERIDTLKSLAKLANYYLGLYKEVKNEKTKDWIDKKAENAIVHLREIIRRINIDLHRAKIDAYCKPMPVIGPVPIKIFLENKDDQFDELKEYYSEVLTQTNPHFTLFDIARLAPEQNIIHDITWLSDGTINDYIHIALQNKPVEFFEKYLTSKIKRTAEELLPYLSKHPNLYDHGTIVGEALEQSKKGNYLASNILLITATESFVREICKFIYQKNNPNVSCQEVNEFIYERFNSLDTLISKGNWPNDFPMCLAEAITVYKDVNEKGLNFWREKLLRHRKAIQMLMLLTKEIEGLIKDPNLLIKEMLHDKMRKKLILSNKLVADVLSAEDFEIKINLSTMLNFLIRKYKDDRNLLIHGNFQALNRKWKNYINYSALLKVYEVAAKYEKLYGKEPLSYT
jgi:hypothetical protein